MLLFRSLAAVAVLTLGSLASAAELTTLVNGANKTVAGDLVAIDGKQCVFKGPTGPAPTPLLEVVSVAFGPEPQPVAAPHTLVELTDGSSFRCKPDSVGFDGEEVKFTLLTGPELKLPFRALAAIVKDAENAKVREHPDLKGILKRLRTADGIVAWSKTRENLSELDGTVIGGKETKFTFKFNKGGITREVDLANNNFQALLFANKADLTRPPSTCRVIDAHRNVFMAAVVESKDGGDFEVALLTGGKLTLKRDQVVVLDFSKGRFDYLSDLPPVVAEEPGDDFLLRYRFYPAEEKDKRNKTLAGGPIQLGGRKFDRGLCLPAPTVLIYDLNGEYKEFAAVVGVDDALAGNNRSRVHLTIEGLDADNKATTIFEGDFDRAKPPLEVRKLVKDVKKLRLTVKSLGALDLWNTLDIADAKVTK